MAAASAGSRLEYNGAQEALFATKIILTIPMRIIPRATKIVILFVRLKAPKKS
jgi:hypothetical protein